MKSGAGQLGALAALVPKSAIHPILGVAAGLGAAYWLTRKEREKWSPFWLAAAGAFVALRASAVVDMQLAQMREQAQQVVQSVFQQGGS